MNRDEIPPGTLYLLILKTLALRGELHGYEIANSIQHSSDDVLQVEDDEVEHADECEADEQCDDARGRERRSTKQAKRDHRISTATLPDDEECNQGRGHGEEAKRPHGGPGVRAGVDGRSVREAARDGGPQPQLVPSCTG